MSRADILPTTEAKSLRYHFYTGAFSPEHTRPPSTIHLVELAPELFSSASGHAGGFLAKDWFRPSVESLGAFSFDLHRKLADEHGGKEKWLYSPTTSLDYSLASKDNPTGGRGDDWLRHGTSRAQAAPAEAEGTTKTVKHAPTWLRREPGDRVEVISGPDTTAQLDPRRLCDFLLQESLDRGVRLHHPASVTNVSTDVRGELAGVRIVDEKLGIETDLPCTRIIIAAGVWSEKVFRGLFRHSKLRMPVGSLAGHSLVLRSPRWKGVEGDECHAIYTTHGEGFAPEIYARLGGDIFIGGVNSSDLPVPEVPGKAEVYGREIARLKKTTKALLGSTEADGGSDDSDLEIVRQALCFRPVTPRGTPIISRVPDEHLGVAMATRPGAEGGVYVATGHGPWGISMALGTGVVLAELAQGRPLSVDISALGLFDE
ncbi:FAD dependent oxidoreductase [Schizothecium vesticola]|uniref:FAD dependent oxidoreductase n=1 Tax=Schizothecium vesticola TaxID=314040 RepID=A0AA40K872_9PEZI|nr:FAD dependent oxidoreductase [Schizothecium vesticola]